jgi:SLT domain-containing protein
MNRQKALAIVPKLMDRFEKVLLEESDNPKRADDWDIRLTEGSVYQGQMQALETICNENKLSYSIDSEGIYLWEEE